MSQKSASYVIGHQVLDEDHDAMVAIWRELEASQTLETAKMAAVKLMNQTAEHFAREEEFMVQCGYPDLARHRGLHRDMIAALRGVLLSPLIGSGKHEDFVVAVRSLMQKWIAVHLVAEDARLAPYVRRAGGRLAASSR